MERFNGTFQDHEINFKWIKKKYTVLIDGFQVYYNYIEKHIDFDGKTSVEPSKIKVDGLNK